MFQVHLARCKIYADSGKHLEAVKEADALLVLVPHHPETLALRAKAKVPLGQTNEALADYSLAISNFPHPEPDLVLERMRLQIESGKTAEAVAGLDEVLKRIGPAIQLQTAAIDCERIAKNYNGALNRLEAILTRMPVKEPWLLQRAEILEGAGRKLEAHAAYQQVLEGLKRYPSNRQAMVVNRELGSAPRQDCNAFLSTLPKLIHLPFSYHINEYPQVLPSSRLNGEPISGAEWSGCCRQLYGNIFAELRELRDGGHSHADGFSNHDSGLGCKRLQRGNADTVERDCRRHSFSEPGAYGLERGKCGGFLKHYPVQCRCFRKHERSRPGHGSDQRGSDGH